MVIDFARRVRHIGGMYALEVRDLRKTYKNGVEALKGVSLTVEEGDFFQAEADLQDLTRVGDVMLLAQDDASIKDWLPGERRYWQKYADDPGADQTQ